MDRAKKTKDKAFHKVRIVARQFRDAAVKNTDTRRTPALSKGPGRQASSRRWRLRLSLGIDLRRGAQSQKKPAEAGIF